MSKKTLFQFLVMVAVLLAGLNSAYAQTQPTITTLSAAVADERTQRLTVASATGFVASTGTLDYGMFVDHEFMRITAVSGTTITVQRGQARTNATAHKSGAYVFVGQYGSQPTSGSAVGGPFIQSPMQGACTATAYAYSPYIQVNAGALGGQALYNCINGVWTPQTLPGDVVQPALMKFCTVPIGSVAYGSFGTSTTASTTGQFTASVFVPQSFIATGITALNGSAVDGSLKIHILNNMSGALIGSSAVAGTAGSGNDAFQAMAFTTPILVSGPATYFIGIQDNAADVNGIRTIAASTFNNVIAASLTSVFGTVGAITPPTTFTADTGPVACLY